MSCLLQMAKALNETFRSLTSGAAATKPLAVLDLRMPRNRCCMPVMSRAELRLCSTFDREPAAATTST